MCVYTKQKKKVENVVIIILDKDKLVRESYMMGRHQTSPPSGLYFNAIVDVISFAVSPSTRSTEGCAFPQCMLPVAS